MRPPSPSSSARRSPSGRSSRSRWSSATARASSCPRTSRSGSPRGSSPSSALRSSSGFFELLASEVLRHLAGALAQSDTEVRRLDGLVERPLHPFEPLDGGDQEGQRIGALGGGAHRTRDAHERSVAVRAGQARPDLCPVLLLPRV